MKKIWFLCIALLLLFGAAGAQNNLPDTLVLTRTELLDKIKGGWAGQTIGVTYGGPYEFRYNGTWIHDYQPVPQVWYDQYIRKTMENSPGLYDDLYMDLTFVEVFERLGLDAPVDSFAHAYAHAQYALWHANQAARYNILNGIRPPQSGHWLHNPHADDIDYQIEADYAGLMSPGLPNAASAVSDKIGHIMNSGDGWYGGVYMGAMYALAFASDDIRFVTEEALKTIPEQSTYYQCMADVIRWHKQYPDDWHQTWFEIQKKWSGDIGCPDGIFHPFNIDAKINSAYVLLGLLYGNGDFGKTMEISTRAGQDADCNPSSAAGILGTMLGYSRIPEQWTRGLAEAENIPFKYTTISLSQAYQLSLKHALAHLVRQGGRVDKDRVFIPQQVPAPVRLEQNFEGMIPTGQFELARDNFLELTIRFEGTGFVLRGSAQRKNSADPDQVLQVEVSIDGQRTETVALPTSFTTRRHEICWKYGLDNKKHVAKLRVVNPDSRYQVRTTDYVVFGVKG